MDEPTGKTWPSGGALSDSVGKCGRKEHERNNKVAPLVVREMTSALDRSCGEAEIAPQAQNQGID